MVYHWHSGIDKFVQKWMILATETAIEFCSTYHGTHNMHLKLFVKKFESDTHKHTHAQMKIVLSIGKKCNGQTSSNSDSSVILFYLKDIRDS